MLLSCMIQFFFKKNFYEVWDNLLIIAVYNIFFLLLFFGGFYLVSMFLQNTLLLIAVLFVFCPVFMIFVCAVNKAMAEISNYKSISIFDFFVNIPAVWKFGVLYGVICASIVFLAIVGMPFYLGQNNFVGLLFAAVLFWVLCIFLFAFQWLLSVHAQLDNGLKKSIRKAFLLFFDNVRFSIFLFFYNSFLFLMFLFVMLTFKVPQILGVFILLLVAPGLSGILLAQNNAFRLRLYKYDWIEQHPEIAIKEARKNIDWEALLEADKEMIGTRSLKSFIFPWKD